MALGLEALAYFFGEDFVSILVPSNATVAKFTRPAIWHSRSTCTNKPLKASRCTRRQSL